LAPAASYPVITVTVLVAGNAGSPLVNSATVSVTGDNNPANDTGTDSVSTLSGPDLTIAKTHNGSFIRGQVGATFTLTMSNIGDLPSSGSVTVADTLPAGLTATAINGTGWACTVTPLTCSRSDGLAPGSSYPVITLTVNVAANAAASLTNTATVTGGSDNNLSNNSASDTVSTASGPDLTIAKSHSGNFTPGQTGAVYTVTVSNNGDQPSVGAVNVTDTLPVGLTATALAGTGWACTVTPLSCTRSDVLAAGAAFPVIVLTVNVANNAAGTLTNNASVVGGGDTNPGNNTATDPTTVATGPDLKITKTHTGSFTRGQAGALFNVVVANQGGSPTVGQVSVVDTLPAGLTATAIAGTGWTCTLATLTCARLDVLAPATSYPAITVTVNVASDAPLTLTNVVDVTGGGAPPTSANTASDFVTVGGNVDLSIAMSHTGILMLGQMSQYTLAVRNVGDVPTSGMVTVTDQLPIGLSAVAIAGTGWSCVLATLTCARSDVLVPGAGYPGIVLSVNVNMDAPPNITNVATVSGGGDSNTGNNSASEVATVVGGVTKVPTLSEWDLILLVLVMMVAGGLSVRRRG